MIRRFTALALLMVASPVLAQAPVIDGSLNGLSDDTSIYGAALSTQNTRTGFGDNSLDDPILNQGGGNEINQVYAVVANDGTQDRLYVMITGNLEGGNLGGGGGNFNKLQVFIDSEPGGMNTIDGDVAPTQFDGFCCGENLGSGTPDVDGGLQRIHGLQFDAGFSADYALAFTHGGENVNGIDFWAVSSHFADLTPGEMDGKPDVGGLGFQLAPNGAPAALRAPGGAANADYNNDGAVNAADYTAYRDSVGQPLGTLPNDNSGGDPIGAPQFDQFAENFGATGSSPTLADPAFKPSTDFLTDTLTQVAIPGLGQGEVIDQAFAASSGCDSDGVGCDADEFAFALPVPEGDANNSANFRNFNNFVGLEMAFDNSNTGGVIGPVDGDFVVDPGTVPEGATEDPTAPLTGVEFSIPLSEIGNPTGDIDLTIFINGGSYNFLSNQISGEGVASTIDGVDFDGNNLGTLLLDPDGPDGPNLPLASLADFVGNQFVTVSQLGGVVATSATVPEPTALLMAAIAAALAPWRRSHRA